MPAFTPHPILTAPAPSAVPSDLIQRNLAFARRLSLRTVEVVTLFHCRIARHDCGVVILFNRRASRRHGPWKLTELVSFKCGEMLPQRGGVAVAS